MVPASSCFGEANNYLSKNSDYYWMHERSEWTGFTGAHIKEWKKNNVLNPSFQVVSGAFHKTAQRANHEDGTGTQGNSVYHSRAPVNWYKQAAQASYENFNGDNNNAPENIDDRLMDWQNNHNFVAYTDSNVVYSDLHDDLDGNLHAFVDLAQSGGSYNN